MFPLIAPRCHGFLRLALSAALAVALSRMAHAQSAWVPTDLGTDGNANSSASDISNAGHIVGLNYDFFNVLRTGGGGSGA